MSISGSDSGDGSFSAPWRTVQHALNMLQPGQTAFVRSGIYNEFIEFQRSGNRGAPIVWIGFSRRASPPVIHSDFKSHFPSIIVKHNISYEMVSANSIDGTTRGFLSELTERFLKRRLDLNGKKNSNTAKNGRIMIIESRY